MPQAIPTYRLHMFAYHDELATEVYCPPKHRVGDKTAAPLMAPYRSDYYKISLCLRGTAELKVNLQTYPVAPGSVVLVTPHTIKQWTHFSDDYETLCVFFTAEFLATTNAQVGKLGFLRSPQAYVLPLTAYEAASLAASFRFLHQKYNTPHKQRKQIIQSLLTGLLYELSSLYEQPPADLPVAAARSQALTAAFKQLVQAHSAQTRHVPFYAAALCVTPKHLSEMVREVTGKTASDLLAEAVLLEAQALLQTTALPIARIADQLHFSDPFAFSRFFKQRTGLSPTAYKQA